MRRLVLLLLLVSPASASAQAEAPVDTSGAGGSEFVLASLSIAPGTFTAGTRVVVSARGGGVVRIGRARLRVRRSGTVSWSPRVAPGRYVARLRTRRQVVATFPVTVTALTPAAAGSRGVFPVRGAWTFGGEGTAFGDGRGGRSHQGQDILAAEGTPVVSPVDGSVAFRKVQESSAGHYLIIRDRDGADYAFMHLVPGSELVQRGDPVRAGQAIAQVGSSGNATGSLLHFEIWPGGWYAPGSKPIDPLPQLKVWAAG